MRLFLINLQKNKVKSALMRSVIQQSEQISYEKLSISF